MASKYNAAQFTIRFSETEERWLEGKVAQLAEEEAGEYGAANLANVVRAALRAAHPDYPIGERCQGCGRLMPDDFPAGHRSAYHDPGCRRFGSRL